MFVSMVLPLTALNSVEQPAFYGREAHALWLDLIARADAECAASLHADQQRKPFTVSSLRCANPRGEVLVKVVKAGAYSLRFTLISARLSELVLEKILPNLPPVIHLGDAQFETRPPVCDAAADAWAGRATSDTLMSKWFAADVPATNQIELEFASPTAFKRQARSFVLPSPALAFASYLSAWNDFASPAFDPKLLATLESDLVVTRYHLRTRAVELRGADENAEGKFAPKQIGFVGRCAFTCFSPERALWRTLHLLADFAFFCGTGYKTTQGLGQTRRVVNQSHGHSGETRDGVWATAP